MDPFRTPPSGRRQGFLHAPHLIAGLVAALLLTACTAGAAGTPLPTMAPSPTPPPTTAPTQTPVVDPTASLTPTAAPLYPMTLTDDEGTRVEIAAEPQRIVSLTPATTEIIFALGAGDRQVAGVDFDDYPPEAVGLPDVATYASVDVEAIVALEADLVIAGGNNFNSPAAIEQLRRLGIPVLVVYAPTVDAVLADIGLVGRAIGRQDDAVAMTSAMRAGIDAVAAAVADLPRPRVFYELDATQEIFGPADDSFIAEMIELAGGEPITTGSPTVFSIALERLVKADPDVIVLGDGAYGVTPSLVAARPGWGTMTAVRTCAIRPVDDLLVTRPGPRLLGGLRLLALAIHPDVELPGPPPPSASPTASPATC